MEENIDEMTYRTFVNKIKTEAISKFGNIRIDSVIKKYKSQYGSNIYKLIERMQYEGRMLRIIESEGAFYVPLGDNAFTISNQPSYPPGIKL